MGEDDKPWYQMDVADVVKKFTGEHRAVPAEPTPAKSVKPDKSVLPSPPPDETGEAVLPESEVSPELMRMFKQGLEKQPAKMDQEKWVKDMEYELSLLHTSLGELIGGKKTLGTISDEIVSLGIQAKTAIMDLNKLLSSKKLKNEPAVPNFNELSLQPPLKILEELYKTLDPRDPEIKSILETMENNIKISQGLGLDLFTEMEMTKTTVKIKTLCDRVDQLVRKI